MVTWLCLLRGAGADLSVMAESEQRLFAEDSHRVACYSRRWRTTYSVRLFGVTTGPNPQDWKLYIANSLDEWAADFWSLIEEGPEPIVPGAWIDE
jgi:hypothetical protein